MLLLQHLLSAAEIKIIVFLQKVPQKVLQYWRDFPHSILALMQYNFLLPLNVSNVPDFLLLPLYHPILIFLAQKSLWHKIQRIGFFGLFFTFATKYFFLCHIILSLRIFIATFRTAVHIYHLLSFIYKKSFLFLSKLEKTHFLN